jgi:hypothetical protein
VDGGVMQASEKPAQYLPKEINSNLGKRVHHTVDALLPRFG